MEPPHNGRDVQSAREPHSSCPKAAGITKAMDMRERGRDQLTDVGGAGLEILQEPSEVEQDFSELRLLAKANPVVVGFQHCIEWGHEAPHDREDGGNMLEFAMDALEVRK